MYSQMAKYYDQIYSFKNYADEISRLMPLLNNRGGKLLDIACGTGEHLKYLKEHYSCTGIDICPELLDIARVKNPEVQFYLMDMLNLQLPDKYDIICSFFGSISHLLSLDNLRTALTAITHHLNPGAMLILEPWHSPSEYRVGTVSHLMHEEDGLKISRMSISKLADQDALLEMHHLVGSSQGIEYFRSDLRLGLWTDEEIHSQLTELGYTYQIDRIRDNGRRMIIATLD